MNRKWEYRVETIPPGFLRIQPAKIEDALNRFGQQGWELVAVKQVWMHTHLYLKKAC